MHGDSYSPGSGPGQASPKDIAHHSDSTPLRLAVFPGQGAQQVGMCKELLQEFKVAREAFEEASDHCHLPLRRLCLDGPDSELQKTEFTQPCLLTASVAAFRVAKAEFDFRPGLVAGHSLGEYSALVAAEALPLGLAAHWVRQRGAAMQAAVPLGQGSMVAILGLSEELIPALCQKAALQAQSWRSQSSDPLAPPVDVPVVVEPANDNAPGQMVLAGSIDGIEAVLQVIKSDPQFQGGKAIPLKVSAPFHCSLMLPARKAMESLFQSGGKGVQTIQGLACHYIPNRTARETREAGLILGLLAEQIDHPVLWRSSMERALGLGYTQGIEFGPGKVLSGLQKRIAAAAEKPFVMKNVSDLATLKDAASWFQKGA